VDENHAPVIYSEPVAAASEGTPYSYPVMAEDLDGDLLVFMIPAAPEGMTIDAETGLVSWTPGPGSAGDVSVTVRVADPEGAFDEQDFVVTVTEGSGPPRITSTPVLRARAGETYRYAATAVDPDDAALTWRVTGPAGMTVSAAGSVEWPVPVGTSGTFDVELTVRDPAGHSDSQTYTIGVARGVSTPTAVITQPDPDDILSEPIEVLGTATSAAFAGYELEACPIWRDGCTTLEHGLEPVDDDVLGVLDPRALANGTYDVRLTVHDASGTSAVVTVRVQIEGGTGQIPANELYNPLPLPLPLLLPTTVVISPSPSPSPSPSLRIRSAKNG
jgi:hypothetical protein